MKEEKTLIEAALFLSSRAMSAEEFRTLTGIGALGYIRSVLDELRKEYDDRGSALEITEMDGKYVMRVRNEHLQRVKQFAQDTEISKSALRTLAYISKNDGILKSALVRKMGTHVYGNVKELVGAGFIRSQKSGRSSKLTLTEKFKKYFTQEIPQQPAGEEQTAL
ncbi:SMC-Scp complex subunit ScpB [Candidatus Micrarchaeota archaeon]|nr:SMC-Scp complex subunit ScpB [Candidatus Micrarchaeota archaeon]